MILGIVTISAALFNPLYRWLQGRVDALLYPERAAFQHALGVAASALVEVGGRQQIVVALQQFAHNIGVAWGYVVLAPQAEVLPIGRGAAVWQTSLQVGGRNFGRFWLGARVIEFSSAEYEQLTSLATQAALALAYADSLDQLNSLNHDLEQKVQHRTAQLLDQQRSVAIFEERQRLARDLHDSVTQTLFSLNLSLRVIRKLVVKQPEMAAEELALQEQSVQHALAEMRSLLTQLRLPLIEDGDLVRALHNHAELLLPRGLTVTIDAPEKLQLSPDVATDLFYIVREALHNTQKHSGQNAAICTVVEDFEQLMITITDTGKGFDMKTVSDGIGLQNMRERAATLGGHMIVIAQPNQGTQVQIGIPFVRKYQL